MPTYIISASSTAADLETSLNATLAPLLSASFIDARVTVVESARVNGTETVIALSYEAALVAIATPYRVKVLEAKTAAALQDLCNDFVTANPLYFTSEALTARYDTARRIKPYVAVLFYNTDAVAGALHWPFAASGGGAPVPVTGVLVLGANTLDTVASATYGAVDWTIEFTNGSLRYLTHGHTVHDDATTAFTEDGIASGPGIGVLPITLDTTLVLGTLSLVATAAAGGVGWTYNVLRVSALDA